MFEILSHTYYNNSLFAMEENQKSLKPSILFSALFNGIAGCFGVGAQTLGLLWHFNLKQERLKNGMGSIDAVVHMCKVGSVVRLYQGFFSAYRSASMARFGDNFFNTFITKKVEKNKYLKNTSIFIQSALIWAFASTWRLAILPIDVLD